MPQPHYLTVTQVRSGQVGAAKVALSESLRHDIQKKWEETVGAATGFMTYEALRQSRS